MRSENTLLWSTWPAIGARSKGVIRVFLFCFVLHLPLIWSIPSRGDIFMPPVDREQPITIDGDRASRWQQGHYEVWHLQGNVQIRQGEMTALAQEGVFWIDRDPTPSRRGNKVIVYLEGDGRQSVTIHYTQSLEPSSLKLPASNSSVGKTWLGRFATVADLHVRAPLTGASTESQSLAVQRATEARQSEQRANIQKTQFVQEEVTSPRGERLEGGRRRIRLNGRSSIRPQYEMRTDPTTNESYVIVTRGVRAVIEGMNLDDLEDVGTIIVETDRMVIWGPNIRKLRESRESIETENLPLELYLEGNIIFREGDRVIYADRMYYDVARKYGVVLNAEILTPAPDYEGLLRVKAEVLQQLDANNFQAYGGAVTSSRMGVPRYWLQSENIAIQDIQQPAVDPLTGEIKTDPRTLQPIVNHELRTTSRNNFVYFGGVPLLYWPVLSTDVTKPSYFVDNLRINSDNVFGTQLMFDFDAYQLFSIQGKPSGTDWTISTDYLSDRGFGHGTQFQYGREDAFGSPGAIQGRFDAWGIRDQGLDNLGADRRTVVPDSSYRGRLFLQHRQQLPNDIEFSAQVGLQSDRNFLEQYFESEYDQLQDQKTGVELKRYDSLGTWSLTADARLNDFYTQTEWLPRLDHFTPGRGTFFDRLTWYEHSHVGYARLQTGSFPTGATAASMPAQAALPWEIDPLAATRFLGREGLRAATRQELDLPFNLGPTKVIPYVLGEAAYWQEDRTAADLQRFYGQVGLRTSLPMWASNPSVQNKLFNLNGLTHKVSFDSDIFWADASEDLASLAMYDQLNDDSIEQFQRMFIFDTFGGTLPLMFDERFYALRRGLQSNVGGPTEIADDLLVFKTGIRQRLQTKRGLLGNERIIDWMVLDVQGSFFPSANRDNFGEHLGLLEYDYRWHIGDRLTLLSDGFVDLFSEGLRKFTAGGMISRPELGSTYLGFRSIEGPITSNVITGSINYRMSEKWLLTAVGSFDLGPTGNIGQSIGFTRIGESFLVRAGFNADVSRGSVGAAFSIEPRFLPSSRLGRVGGVQIPPAGSRGLE